MATELHRLVRRKNRCRACGRHCATRSADRANHLAIYPVIGANQEHYWRWTVAREPSRVIRARARARGSAETCKSRRKFARHYKGRFHANEPVAVTFSDGLNYRSLAHNCCVLFFLFSRAYYIISLSEWGMSSYHFPQLPRVTCKSKQLFHRNWKIFSDIAKRFSHHLYYTHTHVYL